MPRRWAGGRISANGQYGKPSRSSAETSSLRFDVGRPDHLAPLLCFFADELAEVSGRAGKYFTAEFGHSYPYRRIGEHRVDLPIEPLDDLGRGALGNADAEPASHRVARDNIADQRDVWQHS